jgi:predicted nucleic acid-binding protein
LVDGIKASPRITVVPPDSQLLARALRLMAERPDKDWSLTDCSSFVIVQDTGLRDALTADGHFNQAGFHALLAER